MRWYVAVPYIRVCQKCDAQIPDSDAPFEPCEGLLTDGTRCGALAWAVVAVKDYAITKTDCRFLKSLKIDPEV